MTCTRSMHSEQQNKTLYNAKWILQGRVNMEKFGSLYAHKFQPDHRN